MSIFAMSKFLSVLTACHQRSAIVYQLDASGEASKTPQLSFRLHFRMAGRRHWVPRSVYSKAQTSYNKNRVYSQSIFLHLVNTNCSCQQPCHVEHARPCQLWKETKPEALIELALMATWELQMLLAWILILRQFRGDGRESIGLRRWLNTNQHLERFEPTTFESWGVRSAAEQNPLTQNCVLSCFK